MKKCQQVLRRSGQAVAPSLALAVLAGAVAAALAPSQRASAQSFTFTKIADTATPIPGTTGQTFAFNNSDVPVVSSTGRVAFGAGDSSVWTALADGTHLRQVISTSTPIPGWSATFQQYYGDYLQIYLNTAVVVGLVNLSGVGIYTVPARGGEVTRLVDRNTAIPDSTETFGQFQPDFTVSPRGANGNGQIAFENGQQLHAVSVSGGGVTAVAGSQDANDTPPSPYCCIFDSPSLVGPKVAARASNIYGHASIQTVALSGNVLTFRVIANGATHPPSSPGTYRFDDFTLREPVADQATVFRGASNPPKGPPDVLDGIYSRGAATGFVRLVDTTMPVPGGSGNFVSVNGFNEIAASGGVVVFQGLDAANNLGLYAVRESGGAITKIIATGDPIGNGFTVGSVYMGKQALSGSLLVFTVGYADFAGTGMYSTQLVLP